MVSVNSISFAFIVLAGLASATGQTRCLTDASCGVNGQCHFESLTCTERANRPVRDLALDDEQYLQRREAMAALEPRELLTLLRKERRAIDEYRFRRAALQGDIGSNSRRQLMVRSSIAQQRVHGSHHRRQRQSELVPFATLEPLYHFARDLETLDYD